MKPENNLDRAKLLGTIQRVLNEASSRPDFTIGTAVQQVIDQLNDSPTTGDHVGDDSMGSDQIPVAFYDVSAFVDGTLTDTAKVEYIAEAAKSDPGLLMEIIAAIREHQQPPHEAVPDGLRSRLLNLYEGRQQDIEQSAVPTPAPHSAPQINVVAPTSHRGASGASLNSRLVLVVSAIAAAILVAGGLWIYSDPNDNQDTIAIDVESTEIVPPPTQDAEHEEPSSDSGSLQSQPLLADDSPNRVLNPVVKASDEPPSRSDNRELPPGGRPGSANQRSTENLANAPGDNLPMENSESLRSRLPKSPRSSPPNDTSSDSSLALSNGTQMTSPTVDDTYSDIAGSNTNQNSQQLVATWEQIDGLMLTSRRDVATVQSQSERHTPVAVGVGQTTDLVPVGQDHQIQLQTLPFCRATAELGGGGELVMAADTQISLRGSGTVELQHGSIALLNLSPGSTMRVGRDVDTALAIESQNGSIVIHKTVTGMQIDVAGRPATVNGRTYSDARLEFHDGGQVIQRNGDAPDRLPRWTTERVDRIEIGRSVLAQLATSEDPSATMMQALRSGMVQGKAANTLRVWIVAANRDRMLRMIASPDPMIREVALSYIRTVDPQDPRHRLLWRTIQNQGANARAFHSVRSFYVDLWSNRRPSGARREQLLRMLQATDPATRATANYLLRAFYGAGPPFDLAAQPAARTRMVAAWRVIIRRAESR